MNKEIIIGLTGQTGSGKSTVSEYLSQNGLAGIDCDIVARKVTEDSSPCCKELAKLFPSCFDNDLHLDRKALGNIVFNDKSKLRLLNDTIFPYINAEIASEIELRKAEGYKYIVLDAPTLFEAGADKLCDIIISCIADEETRIFRITQRDGISRQQAAARISSQRSAKEYAQSSDIVVCNNGSITALLHAADYIIYLIKENKYVINKKA
ncbi:MAG: dephospho-CoA kinase [Ruminococcus sp.]|nr:dephospho-CoA kinase [Ruminococcus sp.]